MLNTPVPYDLVIGLDRSDKKADLCLIDTHTGQYSAQTVEITPEALFDWLTQLREHYPQARVAIALEQPALNLLGFLEPFEWITLYAINPISLQKFREAFVTSRAKDDTKDALYLAELLLAHHPKLKVWQPEDSHTRLLQQLVTHRRGVVDERTALTNCLQAHLKQYFPQALQLAGDELWRPLATDFLLHWPTLQKVQKARTQTLKQFYYRHGSRSQTLIEQRLALIASAKAGMSMPRKASYGVAGPRPTTGSNATRALLTTPPYGLWLTNGNGLSGAAGKITPSMTTRATRPCYANETAP